jgi:hypothetical protein
VTALETARAGDDCRDRERRRVAGRLEAALPDQFQGGTPPRIEASSAGSLSRLTGRW